MKTIQQIIIKEIPNRMDFYPFCLMHSVSELRYGALRLIDRIKLLFPDSCIAFIGEDKLAVSFTKREKITKDIIYNVPTLIINSNFCMSSGLHNEIIKHIATNNSDIIFRKNHNHIATYYQTLTTKHISATNVFDYDSNDATTHIELQHESISLNNLAEVVHLQGSQINIDAMNYKSFWNSYNPTKYQAVTALGNNIVTGKNVQIAPNVILDSRNGYIILDDEASIMAGTIVVGPCYIGKKTTINPLSYIHPGCSFGAYCKIGGEVESSTFHGFSNKQHHGFIGHSYVSEWVNIGAGTSNSDLKNNYSAVNIQLPHKTINTGQQFMGCLIGDHSKISINCSINTGSIIGCFVNLADTSLTPKLIPSFQWLTNNKCKQYDKEKALNTAKIMMKRRNKTLLQEEIELIINIADS